MYCERCGEPLDVDVHEFVSRKQAGKDVSCDACRPAWMEQLEAVRPSAGTV